jgi:glutamate dehydrogenase (NAD(P)+)
MVASKENATKHLDNIVVRIRDAAAILGLEGWLIEKLTTLKMEWSGSLQAHMKDGVPKEFRAVRIWYRGPFNGLPYKGGIRYHPLVNTDMMKAHAMEMGLKCWLANIPFGGAKGGIAVDPNALTMEELKALTESFVDALNERNILGPFRDVPAPDVGTTPTIMNWVRQRYAQLRRDREDARFAGVVTGKPVGYGMDGLEGRNEATGHGVMAILAHTIRTLDMPLAHPRIAVMGFGNVGTHFVRRAEMEKFPVCAVSDVHGGVYNANGLDIPALFAHQQQAGTVKGFAGGEAITNDELLVLKDIDVLVPAALEHVLTKKNASHVHAKIIIEGANSPTMAEADEIFEDRNIIVIPDILANAGGVTASYFEWARNVNYRDERVPTGERADVLQKMERILTASTSEVIANAAKYNVNLRTAALLTSIERVAPILRAKHTACKVG